MQKQYVEKPYKVMAEQFDPAAPLLPGGCVCEVPPYTDGRPHVHTERGIHVLAVGDWIYTDLFHERYLVMPDAEFSARFGGGALAEGGDG